MDIRFRYLNISDEKNYVSGIALCYNTMEETNTIFEVLQKGFGAKITEKVSIKFNKNSCNTYNMNMIIEGNENLYKIELEGIDSMYIKELEKSIKDNGCIFVVTAQSNIISEFKLNREKYFCVSKFYIDNKKVDGSNNINYSVKELVEQLVSN